ncbi:(2Fe-2S)-binding protein [Oscillospiraceae bacterium LTW-04]|nr:(2Fe-2S)-binding protein [Oscillospiraceae bacterium MB24-C1]
MRVIKHPILEELTDLRMVTLYYNGEPIEAVEGEPVAAALINAGIKVFRTTAKRHEPRSVFCAIGRCTDCMMIVDGVPNTRTCVTPVRDGMHVERQEGLAPLRTKEVSK